MRQSTVQISEKLAYILHCPMCYDLPNADSEIAEPLDGPPPPCVTSLVIVECRGEADELALYHWLADSGYRWATLVPGDLTRSVRST